MVLDEGDKIRIEEAFKIPLDEHVGIQIHATLGVERVEPHNVGGKRPFSRPQGLVYEADVKGLGHFAGPELEFKVW